jgi:hypothetical protein
LSYGDYGHGVLMLHPDITEGCVHLDGTPLDNDSTVPPHDDFAFSFYHGDIKNPDDPGYGGCSAAVWALGPPRQTWPR